VRQQLISFFLGEVLPTLASRETFVPSKIVLKVGFLEREFERNHLAEKSYWIKI
jgi:hypothetical protein